MLISCEIFFVKINQNKAFFKAHIGEAQFKDNRIEVELVNLSFFFGKIHRIVSNMNEKNVTNCCEF